jgi:hypothetical protein
MRDKISVKEILGYISDEKLDFFVQETLVDYQEVTLY